MNHAYRLVWNAALNAYVPVPEFTRRRGKHATGKAAAAAVLAGLAFNVLALPIDGHVSVGQGSISTDGSTMTVTQDSANLAINWHSFSIAPGERVVFQQPDSRAIALNRVLGNGPSAIYGSLQANGKVFLLNPNGVLFGNTAQVNVGGLVASTLGLSDEDFRTGRFAFRGVGGNVTNQGMITANDGGFVALLGGQVSNEGVIAARLGTVALGAGEQITLDFAGDRLVSMQVDKGTLNALAQNRQLIRADGGAVFLTANAADAVVRAVVNNDGVIEARTVENRNGTIVLLGDMQHGVAQVAGTLDASAPEGGDGGFIETSAAQVNVADDARITTAAPQGNAGEWLIDPNDYTIAASGGDIRGATLSSNLANGNVSILSSQGTRAGNGDIFVNDSISWSANTRLTLSAYRNIEINSNITATGNTAGLTLTPNTGGAGGSYHLNHGAVVTLSGSTPGLSIAGQTYTVINNINALQAMRNNLGGRYALGSNIDASVTYDWYVAGGGFEPVGANGTSGFTGTFEGFNHTVSDLFIDKSLGSFYVGLFGTVAGTVKNTGLIDGEVRGYMYVGGLAGSNSGTIENCYTTGDAYAVDGRVGGLVGYNSGAVRNSYSIGDINGNTNNRGAYVGGLVGYNGTGGTISGSYTTASVWGGQSVGGLVGYNIEGARIENSYSKASAVMGNTLDYGLGQSIGGLVGENKGEIINTYTDAGWVQGSDKVGELVGTNYGKILNSLGDAVIGCTGYYCGGWAGVVYAGSEFTGTRSVADAELYRASTFSAWDIATNGGSGAVWRIYDTHSTPLLSSFLKPVSVTANDVTKTYDRNTFSGGAGVVWSVPEAASAFSGSLSYEGTAQGARNAGSYVITPTGYWANNQHGYDLIALNGTLTVNKAPLTITAAGDSKTYDGTTVSPLTPTASGLLNGDTFTLLKQAFSSADVGDRSLSAAYTINDGNGGGNYAVTSVTASGTITPADLTITAHGASKSYGTALVLAGTEFSSIGLKNNETIASVSLASEGFASDATVTGGPYVINATGATGGSFKPSNYAITYVPGQLIVTKANLVVTANDAGKTYDGLTFTGGYGVSYSGFVNGETAAVLGGTIVYGGASQGATNAGSYAISASGLTADNYAIAFQDGTLTIDKAPLTVTANGANKIYDGLAFIGGNGVSYSGFVNGETAAVLGGSTIYGGTSQEAKNAGSYVISASGLSADNYAIAYQDGALTIDKAALTVTANGANKTYDGLVFTGGNGVSYDGFVNGESTTVLGGSIAYGGTSQGAKSAGSYAISASGLTAENYAIAYQDGTLTIDKAALTVTANGTSKTYDGLAFTGGNGVSYDGFVNGETAAVLGGIVVYGGTSQGAKNAGDYVIGASGLTSDNYTIAYQDGTLTIDKATLIVTANDAAKAYDGLAFTGGNGVSYSGFVNDETAAVLGGNLSYAGSAQGARNAGNYTLTATGLSAANYAIDYLNGALSITPAAITISTDDVSKPYDGNTSAPGRPIVTDGTLFVGDRLSGGRFIFSDPNMGTNKTVSVSGVTVDDGNAGNNYTITFVDNSTSAITPAINRRNVRMALSGGDDRQLVAVRRGPHWTASGLTDRSAGIRIVASGIALPAGVELGTTMGDDIVEDTAH